MNRFVYSEAGIRGRRDFTLSDHILKVSGKPGFGEFSQEFALPEIAPHFQRVKCFNQGALRRSTIYLCVVTVVALAVSRWWPFSPLIFGFVTLIFALPGIIVLLRFSRLIEVEQFKSKASGLVVFDLIREKKKAAEFDHFVEKLRAAVLSAQGETPNKAPEPTPGLVTPRAEPRVAPSPDVAHL